MLNMCSSPVDCSCFNYVFSKVGVVGCAHTVLYILRVKPGQHALAASVALQYAEGKMIKGQALLSRV